MKKNVLFYTVLLLFATLAEIVLFFLPWLKLNNDVHLYRILEIPKISDEALRLFSDSLFILPNFFLYLSVAMLALAIIFQFAEIIPVLAGKKASRKTVRIANFLTVAGCVCTALMFVTFWLCVFFGFYPTPYLLIMLVALGCQIAFAKHIKSSFSK
jgi:hypothetical protein